MANKGAEQLEKLIQEQEARLERLRAIHSQIKEDPSVATMLLDALLNPAANSTMTVRPSTADCHEPQSRPLQQVISYFRSQANEWRTARQVAEATGISLPRIHYLLYTSEEKRFFVGNLAGPKKRLWRLKGEADQTAEPPGGSPLPDVP